MIEMFNIRTGNSLPTADYSWLTLPDRPCIDVRDFGAKGDGITDDTAAMDAALATGRSIFCPEGIYLTTGGHRIAADGQKIIGAGWGLYNPGTTIKKSGGTNYILDTGHGYNDIGLENIMFDRNDLNGSGVIWRGHYSRLKNIYFKNSAGTGYDLHISGVNVSQFDKISADSILIDQSSDTYTPQPSYGCMYSTFKGVICRTLEFSGSQARLLSFEKLLLDGAKAGVSNLWLHASTMTNLYFYDTDSEADLLDMPLVTVDNPAAYNIHFIGGYLSTAVAQTQPVFYFRDVQDISVEKVLFNDYYSLAGRHCIEFENIKRGTFEDNDVTALNNFYFLYNAHTLRSEYITSKRNKSRPVGAYTGTGTNYFIKTDHLTIEQDEFIPIIGGGETFHNISDVPDFHSVRTGGKILVNDDGFYDIFGDGGNNSPGADFGGMISISAGGFDATSQNNFALFYAQSGAGSGYQNHTDISTGSNVEIINMADSAPAALASTTDGKLGVQIGGGAAATRYIRIYNRTGAEVSLRVHIDRYEE
uniref:Putative pectate lyase n=1 Tax=viral metagenome TaxID=1070528 RepID=A0A6M3IYW9_9ZZZZ